MKPFYEQDSYLAWTIFCILLTLLWIAIGYQAAARLFER